MRWERTILTAAFVMLTQQAFALDHESAFALAALVAEKSPLLSANEKLVMARLFDQNFTISFPANRKIIVEADAVVCEEIHSKITSHSCDLIFRGRKISIAGRRAHELYATIIEAGVQDQGAAGTISEAVSQLKCTIDPNEILTNNGAGADCKFLPGKPRL